MRFLGVWLVLFVVGGIGVAPVAAAEPQAAAPVAAAEKEKAKGEKAEIVPIPWPEKYDPRTLKPIRLFMTREEVRKMWGEPAKFSFSKIDREKMAIRTEYFSREEHDEAVRKYGLLNDIYFRKIAPNQFAVRVVYKKVGRQDSENSGIRVSEVIFNLAKPVPIFDFLNVLPEVTELCGLGCGVYGNKTGLLHIVVYPQTRTLNQRIEADQMARIWDQKYYEKWFYRLAWTPVLKLYLERRFPEKDQRAYEIDWIESPIDFIRIGLQPPQEVLEAERKYRSVTKDNVFELGTFVP